MRPSALRSSGKEVDMTAPDTNVEKQARRHRASMIALLVAVVFAIAAALFWSGGDEVVEEDAVTSTVPATDG